MTRHAAVGPRHLARHHAPLPATAIRGGVRRAPRASREGVLTGRRPGVLGHASRPGARGGAGVVFSGYRYDSLRLAGACTRAGRLPRTRMYGHRDDLTRGSRDRRGLLKRELVMTTPQGAHVAVEGRGELLNLCANNYLGLANHPDDRRGRARGARPLGLRHGLGAVHLRHAGSSTASSRSASRRSSARTTRSSTARASTPTAASSRRCSASEDAVISDAAQPRLDHRRHPPLQGAAAPLRERRHGRARGAPERGGRTRAAG